MRDELTHLTLTTGRRSCSKRAEVAYRDVELLRPMVKARRGVIGGFAFAITVSGDGAAGFKLGEPEGRVPVVACTLCWLPERSSHLWRILDEAMERHGVEERFEKMPVPWLAVALLPDGMTDLTRKNLRGEGPFIQTLVGIERAIAWTVLELELGASWC